MCEGRSSTEGFTAHKRWSVSFGIGVQDCQRVLGQAFDTARHLIQPVIERQDPHPAEQPRRSRAHQPRIAVENPEQTVPAHCRPSVSHRTPGAHASVVTPSAYHAANNRTRLRGLWKRIAGEQTRLEMTVSSQPLCSKSSTQCGRPHHQLEIASLATNCDTFDSQGSDCKSRSSSAVRGVA